MTDLADDFRSVRRDVFARSVRAFRHLLAAVRRAAARRRTRRQLAALEEFRLDDVGLSAADASREIGKSLPGRAQAGRPPIETWR